MPLPYDHLGGWTDAMDLYVNEQLKCAVGLFSATSNTRNPVLSCGYRLLDSNHSGGVDLSDVLDTLRAQADLRKWNGPASATNQTGGPHFFRVINEQSSSWTYDYAQIIRDQQWNTTVGGLIPAELDAPNPTTGSDAMSVRMIKAEFGNLGGSSGTPISAYYGADANAPYATPTSGELKWSDFYGGAAAETFYEIDRFKPASNSNWVTRTVSFQNTDVGAPLSITPPTLGRIIFRWQNGNASTAYRGDFQLGWFAFKEGSNIVRRWGFNGDKNIPSFQQSFYIPGQYTTSDPGHYGYIGEGWEYYDSSSAVTESEYINLDSSLWKEIGSNSSNGSSTSNYIWNRDTGGTPSSITGVSSNHTYGNNSYIYAETSGSSTLGAYYWVRSPVFKLDDVMFTNNCDAFTYQYGAYGSNCPSGECTVFLEKLSYPVYTNTLWAVGRNPATSYSGSSNFWPQDYTFTFYFIDMQEFQNSTGWGIYEYINGGGISNYWQGDIQIDDTAFNARSNSQNAPITTSYPEDYHFRVTGQTNAQTTRPHNFLQRHIDGTLGWERLSTGYSTTQYQWNLDYGGTPSGGTGRSDDADGGTGTNNGYAYAETSGTNTYNYHYYMRTNRGENYGIQRYWYFRFAGVGANCGTLNCRLLLDGEED
jgi:hypothetical protein